MTRILSLYLYTSVSSSVWHFAKAAPVLDLHSIPSGVGTFGGAGHVANHPFIDTLSDFKLDHNLADRRTGPQSLRGALGTSAEDSFQEDKTQRFLVLYTEFQNPKSHLARPLSLDTADQWQVYARHAQELTGAKGRKIGSLKNWLQQHDVVEGPDFERTVSDLQWMLNRVNSQQAIWWRGDEITKWKNSNYDFKSMIELGDLLRFDEAEQEFKLSSTRITKIQKELIPLLESARWTKPLGSSFLNGHDGAEASKEIQTLRVLKPYANRMGQVVDKIDLKMANYQGHPSHLPDDLKSDLYLLALLRGKATNLGSTTEYGVALPNHLVTVIKPHDQSEIKAQFIATSQARRLSEIMYHKGDLIVEPEPGRAAKVWGLSPNPSPSNEPLSISPSRSPSPSGESLSRSPTEAPTPSLSDEDEADELMQGGGPRLVVSQSSPGSRATSLWHGPISRVQEWVKTFSDKYANKGGNLQTRLNTGNSQP